jgi:hypothetical protein
MNVDAGEEVKKLGESLLAEVEAEDLSSVGWIDGKMMVALEANKTSGSQVSSRDATGKTWEVSLITKY